VVDTRHCNRLRSFGVLAGNAGKVTAGKARAVPRLAPQRGPPASTLVESPARSTRDGLQADALGGVPRGWPSIPMAWASRPRQRHPVSVNTAARCSTRFGEAPWLHHPERTADASQPLRTAADTATATSSRS